MKRVFALLLASTVGVGASDWYFDNMATGAHSGTNWANAWTSPSQFSGVGPGDTVYISGGTSSQMYTGWTNWIPISSGTAGSPIVYRVGQDAGHNGAVIIDGGGSAFWWAAESGNARHWIAIDGEYRGQGHLTLQNFSTLGAYADQCNGLVVRYVTFNSPYRNVGGTPTEFDHCLFNIINGDAAILADGAQTVHNCTFYLSRDASTGFGDDGVHGTGSGSVVCSNSFIGIPIVNYTSGEHQDGVQTWVSNLKIYDNYFFNLANSATFIAPIGSASDLSYVWIYNNVAEYCTEGIAIGNNNGDGSTANLHNFLVANNTIVDSGNFTYVHHQGGSPGSYNNWHSDDIVANNIVLNSGGATLDSNISSYNNVVLSSVGSGSFVKYSPAANAYISTNDYDFHLLAGDPNFKDKGASLAQFFTTDKDGVTRPQGLAWDVGAYEYGRGPSTNPVIVVYPVNLDFGAVRTNTSTNLAFTVQNVGGGTLTGVASVAAPFGVVSGGTYSLGSNRTQTVTVGFTPKVTGTTSQTVTFAGGGGAGVSVTGRGY